tara:strand:+ start:1409 stop:1534 length:126 start_codon:yes stop_codon:yes gene_type:complete
VIRRRKRSVKRKNAQHGRVESAFVMASEIQVIKYMYLLFDD